MRYAAHRQQSHLPTSLVEKKLNIVNPFATFDGI
jgi:hypothetical protein